MGNIGNNGFESIFLSLSTHFWEETNIVGPTCTFTLFILSSQFSLHIQTKEINFVLFNFFPSPLLSSIFHSTKQSLSDDIN